MPKNIVIFADGTAQKGGSTNVSKLSYMAESRSPEQLVLYLPGVGTEQSKVAGNIGGMGISRYMLECYEFINANFLIGDSIFLFGFSRGATTVVSLAKFIYLFGLLPRRPGVLQEAYKLYRKLYRIDSNYRKLLILSEFGDRNHKMWCSIKFLGLFDAVASLGVPFPMVDHVLDYFLPHRFHVRDLNFPGAVRNLYHALAIDEERLWFQPMLSNPPVMPDQNHKQVWFCGSHGDLGGGYYGQQELSDIPLEWMMHKAAEHGLKIYPHHGISLRPHPDGRMSNPGLGLLGRYYPKRIRSWDSAVYGKPRIHKSVLERTLNPHNAETPRYASWILDGSLEYDVEPWSHT